MSDVTKTPYAHYFFPVNYCLFANGEISIRFNGQDDNVVLECHMIVSGCDITLHLGKHYENLPMYIQIFFFFFQKKKLKISLEKG